MWSIRLANEIPTGIHKDIRLLYLGCGDSLTPIARLLTAGFNVPERVGHLVAVIPQQAADLIISQNAADGIAVRYCTNQVSRPHETAHVLNSTDCTFAIAVSHITIVVPHQATHIFTADNATA